MSKTLIRTSRTSPRPASGASELSPLRSNAQDRRTPIRPSAAGAFLANSINGHPAPGRLRYVCPDCTSSTLLPFTGEAPWHFSMTSAGGQRSAVAWKNHPSLHLWTCPRSQEAKK
jgi:hypothetical protein